MRTALLVLATTALLRTGGAQGNDGKFVSKGLFDGQQLELRIHQSKLRYALGESVYLIVEVVNHGKGEALVSARLLYPARDRDWTRFRGSQW